MPLTAQQCAAVFSRLGLHHTHEDGVIRVTPTSWRFDLVIEEELIEEVSFPVYRRVATLIFLPADAGEPSSIEMVNVDPVDLAAAHQRDQAA